MQATDPRGLIKVCLAMSDLPKCGDVPMSRCRVLYCRIPGCINNESFVSQSEPMLNPNSSSFLLATLVRHSHLLPHVIMATQLFGQNAFMNWSSIEEDIGLELMYNSQEQPQYEFELPQLQSGLPIIRPPEGCEKMKPTEFNDPHYEDLPTPTCIRILKLFPGKDEYSDFEVFRPPVRCSIIVADLNDNPSYDALSYTWGDPCTLYLSPEEISPQAAWAARPFVIEVDGEEVSVGANLYAALLALRFQVTHHTDPRLSDTPQTSGHFWIDALCINQTDLKEKSSQVMMMSRIYQQACFVYTWLGGGDRLSRQALYDLVNIAKLSPENDGIDPKDLRKFDIEDCETYQKLGIPKLGYTSWIGIYLFLNRAWFKRAWIVQEVALARKPWFMCGMKLGNVEVILKALEVLHESRWYDQMRNLAEPLIQNHRNESDCCSKTILTRTNIRLHRPRETHMVSSNLGYLVRDIRTVTEELQSLAEDESAPKWPSLSWLLEMYRFTESGDARDKVYAFVGLSSEQETRPLKVDYERKVEEVFVEAARHIMGSMGNLRILSLKKPDLDAGLALKLPSWVPDFTVPDLTPSINQHHLFSASQGLEKSGLLYLPGDELQLFGAKIDTVKDVATTMFHWAIIAELNPLFREVTPPEGQTVFEALWRTLLLDQYEGRTPAPRDCGNNFLNVLEERFLVLQIEAAVTLRCAERLTDIRAAIVASMATPTNDLDQYTVFDYSREKLGTIYTTVQRLLNRCSDEDEMLFPPEFVEFENQRKQCKSEEEDDSVILNFFEESHKRLKLIKAECGDILYQILGNPGRLLFVTEKGFLGLGSSTLEIGDEVWILAGADVPFVLRPSGLSADKFCLVGEAYVHGAMQGEAVERLCEGDLRTLHIV